MSRYSDRVYRERSQALKRQCMRDGTPCSLCGLPFDWDLPSLHAMGFTADHIKSIKQGGSLYGALRPAHRSCNSRRGGDDRQLKIPRPASAGFWGPPR